MTATAILAEGPSSFVQFQLLEPALRAVLIYLGGFVLIRFGKNRLLGRSTPFDIVLGIVLGSLLSRAINGTAEVTVTIVAAASLVGFHTLVSWLSRRSRGIERIVKGRQLVLVQSGKIDRANARQADISAEDLGEALRLRGGVDCYAEVERASLERNGEISVIRAQHPPRVIEIDVADGVQKVRIAWE
ncbi:MAG: DUF421 domain-containing protein [Phycisphaerae bacterium]|nr:DUF421 domain-containing protein [Phycisphaerae bacterium]